MKQSEQLNELASAMSKLQSEIRDAEKDNQAYNYKYADLGTVLGLIRPLLAKNGLSFQQHVGNADGKVVIETIIMHSSGQWISSELAMPEVQSKSMNAAQGIGSVITYGRRYALTAIFGITQVDDDGSAGKSEPARSHTASAPSKNLPSKGGSSDIPWENITPALVTEKEVEQLGTMIFEAEADIEKLMEAYKVKRFEQMTKAQYEDAMRKLKKKIEHKEKK
jgi:hypothetical protein